MKLSPRWVEELIVRCQVAPQCLSDPTGTLVLWLSATFDFPYTVQDTRLPLPLPCYGSQQCDRWLQGWLIKHWPRPSSLSRIKYRLLSVSPRHSVPQLHRHRVQPSRVMSLLILQLMLQRSHVSVASPLTLFTDLTPKKGKHHTFFFSPRRVHSTVLD